MLLKPISTVSLAFPLLLATVPATLAEPVPGHGDPLALAAALPPDLLKEIRHAPDRYEEDAASLILTYGTAGVLTPAGIDRMIRLMRAKARAAAEARFLGGDLDDDGRVSRNEADALIAISSQTVKGRLDMTFRHADTNQDGTLDEREIDSFGQSAALDSLDDESAARMSAMMAFDLDNNGGISVAEVLEAVNTIVALPAESLRAPAKAGNPTPAPAGKDSLL